MRAFAELYDKNTLTVEFPRILNQIEGTDTKSIEIITSSLL